MTALCGSEIGSLRFNLSVVRECDRLINKCITFLVSAKPAEDQKEDRFPFPWLPSVRTNKRTGVHAYEYGSENVTFSCQVDDIGKLFFYS